MQIKSFLEFLDEGLNGDYVKFKSRDFNRFKGDKFTWAKENDDGTISVKKGNGTMSDAYYKEIKDYCSQFGVDFDKDIRLGTVKTFPGKRK